MTVVDVVATRVVAGGLLLAYCGIRLWGRSMGKVTPSPAGVAGSDVQVGGGLTSEGRVRRFVRSTAVAVLVLLVCLGFVWDGYLSRGGIGLAIELRVVAAVLAVVSLVGLAWVHAALGRHFTPELLLASDHRLVTQGPYRWVRHPMYSAIFVFFPALAVWVDHWVVLVWTGVVMALIGSRIPLEEEMMSARFRERWEDYRADTGALFPRVHRSTRHDPR